MSTYMKAEKAVIPPALDKFIEELSSEYMKRTGNKLFCTSGLRTIRSQAEAMFINMTQKNNVNYAQAELQKEIEAAYNSTPTVSAIEAALLKQVSNGKYISAHMKGDAADFSKSMDIEVFKKICKEKNRFCYVEIPCVHVTFGRPWQD